MMGGERSVAELCPRSTIQHTAVYLLRKCLLGEVAAFRCPPPHRCLRGEPSLLWRRIDSDDVSAAVAPALSASLSESTTVKDSRKAS